MSNVNALENQDEKRQEIFDSIYATNFWGGRQSVSGTGSDPEETEELRSKLPALLRDLKIDKLLDLPCGDHLWMHEVMAASPHLEYIGGDIVDALTQSNQAQYGNARTHFLSLDLCTSVLPAADLLLCRDCLVHLSYADLFKALRNIANSQITYIATTSFINHSSNFNITTGAWRPLNLELAPFFLPTPLAILDERLGNGTGPFTDKSLVIWSVRAIRDALNLSSDNAPQTTDFGNQNNHLHLDLQTPQEQTPLRLKLKALTSDALTHASQLVKRPHIQSAFSATPVAFAMVKLDHLIVTQTFLDLCKLRTLTMALALDLEYQALHEICLPLRASNPAMGIHTPDVLDSPEKTSPTKIEAAAIKMLHAVRYGDRLILNGDFYLACALRALGIKRAPCLIQVCTSVAEVMQVGPMALRDDPKPFLEINRPALLGDFFEVSLTTRDRK